MEPRTQRKPSEQGKHQQQTQYRFGIGPESKTGHSKWKASAHASAPSMLFLTHLLNETHSFYLASCSSLDSVSFCGTGKSMSSNPQHLACFRSSLSPLQH